MLPFAPGIGMIDGLTASELSKAERGEKDLTQAELKAIAKICGVTQKSLLDAAGASASAAKTASSTAKKTSTSTAKKTSTSTAKKTSTSTAKKTSSTAATGEKLTATEKKFLELYRAASSSLRKDAEAVLKGTKKVQEEDDSLMGSLLGGALEALTGLGKK